MGREDRQILSHQAPVLEPRDTHLALRSLFPHPWVASTQENPEAYWGGVFRSIKLDTSSWVQLCPAQAYSPSLMPLHETAPTLQPQACWLPLPHSTQGLG